MLRVVPVQTAEYCVMTNQFNYLESPSLLVSNILMKIYVERVDLFLFAKAVTTLLSKQKDDIVFKIWLRNSMYIFKSTQKYTKLNKALRHLPAGMPRLAIGGACSFFLYNPVYIRFNSIYS